MRRFAGLLIGLCFSWTAAQAASLDEDLDALFETWAGEFDATPGGQGGLEIYAMLREVELPAFGERVLYMENRASARDGKVLRQRIFSFDTTEDRTENVLKSYDFLDGAPYQGAIDNPALLSELTPEDMYHFPDGCEIRWSRDGDVFTGAVKREDCLIPSRTRGMDLRVDLVFKVSRQSFTQQEEGYDTNDVLQFGSPDGPPVVSVRAPAVD